MRQLRVLALACSPRQGGNTETLLDRFVEGLAEGAASVEKLHVPRLVISGCIECNGCFAEGCCVVQDDFQYVAEKLTEADRVVIATPIFFMGPSSQAKALIDRCQSFWARKYVVKAPLKEEPSEFERRGAWLAVGGTRGKRLFDGTRMTMKYFFDAIYISDYLEVTVRGVDSKGDILKHEDALAEAFAKGKELAKP